MDKYVEHNIEPDNDFDLDDTVTQVAEGIDETSEQNEPNEDDDLESLPPDQDHNDLIDNSQKKAESDVSLLNAKITSLEVDLGTARNMLKGNELDLR